LRELTQLGHKLSARPSPMGDAKCIVLDGPRAYGYADPREGGLALPAAPAQSASAR
jgi:gamma-glutamyltranspeptidase